MTNREFLNTVVSGVVNDEVKEWAKLQLEKMDSANEKRRNSVSKAELVNAPIREQIISEFLTTDGKTASMIAEEMREKGIEISHNKVTAILRKPVEEGLISKIEVKVPKKGKQKAYCLIS